MSVELRGNKNQGKESLSFKNIKFAYFDVGDVLLRFSNGLREISRKVSLPSEDCLKIWQEMDDSICRGETDPQELWKRIKRVSSYKGDDIDFVSFWVDHFEPIPEVHKLVGDLSRDCGVGLLTNIYPGVYQHALEKDKIPNIPYTSVIQSCDVHSVKPEPEIFALAASKVGVKHEEILFIDNNPRFLSPAISIGWKTFLFDPQNTSQSVKALRTGFGI